MRIVFGNDDMGKAETTLFQAATTKRTDQKYSSNLKSSSSSATSPSSSPEMRPLSTSPDTSPGWERERNCGCFKFTTLPLLHKQVPTEPRPTSGRPRSISLGGPLRPRELPRGPSSLSSTAAAAGTRSPRDPRTRRGSATLGGVDPTRSRSTPSSCRNRHHHCLYVLQPWGMRCLCTEGRHRSERGLHYTPTTTRKRKTDTRCWTYER